MTPTLATILSLALWHGDAHLPLETRTSYLRPVAEAIDAATRDRHEAAALIAQGWHESRYARYVVEGRCSDGPRGARCDPDAEGRPQARGPWQVWRWCRAAWRHPAGSPQSLRAEAQCVVRWMRGARSRCGGGWVAAFSAMRGASLCTAPWARARVVTMRRVLAGWRNESDG